MQALRQIEATIDSVVSVLSNSIPGFVTASSNTSGPQVGIRLSHSCFHLGPVKSVASSVSVLEKVL